VGLLVGLLMVVFRNGLDRCRVGSLVGLLMVVSVVLLMVLLMVVSVTDRCRPVGTPG
jgi:hypothetical protein